MFRRILIPTDGSKVAGKAVRAGIRFAGETGAAVVGYCAIEPVIVYSVGESVRSGNRRVAELERQTKAAAEGYLAAMRKQAAAAGVRFESLCDRAATPYDGIVAAARKKKCDTIFMASRGRSGLEKLLMGSVTSKVLVRSKIPVLVYR
ncbi:MAG: universal stress protein [Burkholderiales bacterium]